MHSLNTASGVILPALNAYLQAYNIPKSYYRPGVDAKQPTKNPHHYHSNEVMTNMRAIMMTQKNNQYALAFEIMYEIAARI